MGPLRENAHVVHVSEEVDREEIQGIQRRGGEEGLVEQVWEFSHGGLPVGVSELAERMMISNTVHGAEIGCHRAKILRFLLSQEPFGGGFHGPVVESVNRPFLADAEHGERMALVLLVLEVDFFVGDEVLLGGCERERMAILIGRGRHDWCFPSWYCWCDMCGFNFYRVYIE